MNTSTPPPLMGSNNDSKDDGQMSTWPSSLVNNSTENHHSQHHHAKSLYETSLSSTESNVMNTGTAASNTRKLIRTESTYEEDLFDESIRDLSHLNHQRYVLRQQWFRKNNLVNRLRRSTSSASNSSSSSSGISSNIYSNATNTSSFGSSFSSSFSATLSSLSESCDNDVCVSPIGGIGSSNENDYPKILRKSSFKNKLIHCYKPYYKPRRFSLQLLKNNLELPDNLKLYSSSSSSSTSNRSRSSMMKYSMTFHSIGNKDKRCLFAISSSSAKSNPSSPNKSIGGYMGVAGGNQGNDISQTMNTTQVIIDSSDSNEASCNQDGIMNSVVSGVVCGLVRSKSLDDLNTLFCGPTTTSLCSSNCLGHDTATGTDATAVCGIIGTCANAMINANIAGACHTLQPASITPHYSSFNRICDSPKTTNQPTVQHQHTELTTGSGSYFNTSNQQQHLIAPGQQHAATNNTNTNTFGCFNLSNGNNIRGISISSSQINNGNNNNHHQTTSNTNCTCTNHPSLSSSSLITSASTLSIITQAPPPQPPTTPTSTTTTTTHVPGNPASPTNNNNNNSLCDIDHVMKKISSLRV